MWKKFLLIFRNKYLLTTLVFAGWILFFDQNNLLTQYTYRKELNKLNEDRQYFIREIQSTIDQLNDLTSNSITLEKFARENYLMKRDHEEVFVLVEKQ